MSTSRGQKRRFSIGADKVNKLATLWWWRQDSSQRTMEQLRFKKPSDLTQPRNKEDQALDKEVEPNHTSITTNRITHQDLNSFHMASLSILEIPELQQQAKLVLDTSSYSPKSFVATTSMTHWCLKTTIRTQLQDLHRLSQRFYWAICGSSDSCSTRGNRSLKWKSNCMLESWRT